jgi:hypothetical protein
MERNTIIIILFAFQCLLNLVFCFWAVYEIVRLKLLIAEKHTIQQNEIDECKRDINNLGSLLRQSRASFEGKLTRFMSECSIQFNQLKINPNFTYPNDPKDLPL